MNRIAQLFLLLSLVSLSSCSLFRQAGLASDPRSDALIMEGKRALNQERYLDAWDAFEMAREREFNRSTTAATYLAGLSAYYLGYEDIAEARFSTIINRYPRSRYVEDARYHRSLMQLAKTNSLQIEFEALDDLLALHRGARDPRLKELALMAWRQHLFERADRDLLETYSRTAPASYQTYIMEALIHRIAEEDGLAVAKIRLDSYRQEGGTVTEWLNELFPEAGSPGTGAGMAAPSPRWQEPNLLKVALVLPLHLRAAGYAPFLDQMPDRSVRPLEFYEGFQMAVKDFQLTHPQQRVFVKVIDSERDTLLVRQSFWTLDSLGIQLVIGDIYNAQSRILAEWAESRKVPQIVPLSPSEELVAGREHSFLANPTATTHGARMAEYAYRSLELRRVFVFSDGGSGTEQLAQGFKAQFQLMGGQIDSLTFSGNYENAGVDQIPSLIKRLPNRAPATGVYIPVMGNEAAASLILNLMQQQGKDLPVMGSPHFRNAYNTISPETKAAFSLVFSTSYLVDRESAAFRRFYRQYLEQYGLPPSEDAVQGYDLGMYALDQLARYNPNLGFDLSAFLRIGQPVPGLHLDYQFSSEQSNQRVNLGQYTDLGVIPLE